MKSETFASTKFLLAALGLAFVKAGQVLVEESSKLDVMDDALPEPNDAAPEQQQITTDDITDAPLDKTGLPWDTRIHSGNKTINADGTWKKRKGVSDTIVDAVTAELRATVDTVAPAPVVVPPPPAPAPVVQIPLPVTAPVANDYTKLCDFLAKNTGEGTSLPDEWVTSFFAANNTSLPALATDQDACNKLLASLRGTLQQYNIAEVV